MESTLFFIFKAFNTRSFASSDLDYFYLKLSDINPDYSVIRERSFNRSTCRCLI